MKKQRVVLRNSSTGDVLDPKTCPKGILAPAHWNRDADPDGETPNLRCDCHPRTVKETALELIADGATLADL